MTDRSTRSGHAKMSRSRRSQLRVLLDTNVWRYVADKGAGADLLRVTRIGNARILIAPSVLYETLRTGDAELRSRLVALMVDKRWKRLMPEAYSESRELLAEIRRLRPNWLRANPDRGSFMRLRHDWAPTRSGFWERVRRNPDIEAGYLIKLGDRDQLDKAREEASARRQEFFETSWHESIPLDEVYAAFSEPTEGWSGDPVQPWRVAGWSTVTYAFEAPGHPYVEWLESDVDFNTIASQPASWLRFWLYEVDVKVMPRFWLRWAFEFLQRFRRVTGGTPCDSQLATYLPQADFVVTADKAFLQVLDKCRPTSPCRLPASVLIPAGERGVEMLLSKLSSVPSLGSEA